MQLALDALDRLVEILEERGPLSVVDAARALFATPSISDGLAASLIEEVIAGDSRVTCIGGAVSLSAPRDDPLLEEAVFVVFDLETTGLSSARDQICELGAVRVRALELADSFQSLVDPRVALPEPIARLTGLREEELRGAPGIGQRPRAVPRVRRRRPARRAQRPLRPALPRAAAPRAARAATLRAPALHRGARAAAARRTSAAGRPRLARELLRSRNRALPPRAARRGGDRRDPRPPDRPRAGDRGAAALRPARARGAAETTRLRQALARQRRADPARASTSSATATTRCCTSGEPATCAPACARTSAPTASDLRSRRPCTRSTASSGASSARSSKRPSRRCA